MTTASGTGVRIEKLAHLEQFEACVALQNAVWGYEPNDAVSQKIFLLAQHIGGQLLGAYEGRELVGYAMSLPGIRDGQAYLHSHHLAVLPQWRNARMPWRVGSSGWSGPSTRCK